MPRLVESHRDPCRRPRAFGPADRPRRTALPRCKLDSSTRLIAPPHSLQLPSLEGVRARFQFSIGTEAVLPLARVLIENSLLLERHLKTATSPVAVVQAVLTDIVSPAFSDGHDPFSIELGIVDRLDEYRKPERDALFFIWNNTADPQYIPLRPIYERLDGNPQRTRLMASLYQWLYRTASRLFAPFAFAEAKHIYEWRRDAYISERDAGEDVDLEGEVEYADPAKIVDYIRNAHTLRFKSSEIRRAIESLTDSRLRDAFQRAHRMYLESRAIRLPAMSKERAQLVDEAAYYMDGSPLPAVGISHWRDDPVVSWFDEFCQDQFESGESPRAAIILCFSPGDTQFFMRIVRMLPRMARVTAALGNWVRFAEELENASCYADREDA